MSVVLKKLENGFNYRENKEEETNILENKSNIFRLIVVRDVNRVQIINKTNK